MISPLCGSDSHGANSEDLSSLNSYIHTLTHNSEEFSFHITQITLLLSILHDWKHKLLFPLVFTLVIFSMKNAANNNNVIIINNFKYLMLSFQLNPLKTFYTL